jgi:serine/threonine protein kinase/tetratricopeptide (TPR) repeat protein
MATTEPSQAASLSHLDNLKRRWQAGERIRVEDYLQIHSELIDQPEIVRDLIYQEYCLREESEETPRADEYLDRFPEFRESLRKLFELHAAVQSDDKWSINSTGPHEVRCPTCQETIRWDQSRDTGTVRCPKCKRELRFDDTVPGRSGSINLGTIGPYRLLTQLGEGGFGVVYAAEQTEPVRRTVALKIIKPGMDSREAIARFEAERQALALMDHPHIARVFDAGQTDSGRPYFVMELVKGIPITQYCDSHCLSIGKRLELFISVCRATQHAHHKGVIHLDIKPSNVLITLEDGQAAPKVIDFGVAKAIHQPFTENMVSTAIGQLIGTPAYMSPEQVRASGLDIDTRTDIYSLGVLLYELLTSTLPVDMNRLRGASFEDLQRLICEEEPPKPSSRVGMLTEMLPAVAQNRGVSPKKFVDHLRGELDWIVMKALERERDRRYETAASFAADIERFQNNVPVEASPPSVTYKLRKFVQRNRVAVAFAGIVLLALVIGIIGTSYGMMVASVQRGRADGNFRKAWAAVDRYLNRVTEDERLKTQGLESLRRDLLLEAREFYDTLLAEATDNSLLQSDRGTAFARLGRITAAVGTQDEAIRYFKECAETFEQLLRLDPTNSHYHYELAKTQNDLGIAYQRSSQYQKAETCLRSAQATFDQLLKQEPKSTKYLNGQILTYSYLGQLYARTRRLGQAQQTYSTLRRIVKELGTASSLSADTQLLLAANETDLGIVLRRTGRFNDAIKAHQVAIGILEAYCNDERNRSRKHRHQLELVRSQHGIGNAEYGLLHYDRAERHYLSAREIAEQLVRDYPDVESYQDHLAITEGGLGLVYQSIGDFDKAIAAYRSQIKAMERLTEKHPDEPHYHSTLGKAYGWFAELMRERRKWPEALDLFQKAIVKLDVILSRDPGDVDAKVMHRQAYLGRAQALVRLGSYVEAAQHVESVLRTAGGHGITETNIYAADIFAWACAAAQRDQSISKQERVLRKEEYAARADQLLTDAVNDGVPTAKVVSIYANLGHDLLDAENPEAAIRWYDKATQTMQSGSMSQQQIDKLDDMPEQLQTSRARAQAMLGDYQAATAQVESLVRILPDLSRRADVGRTFFNCACVYSEAVAAANKDKTVSETDRELMIKQYSDRAVELLYHARTAGYFEDANNLKFLENIKPLLDWKGFEQFLQELRNQ